MFSAEWYHRSFETNGILSMPQTMKFRQSWESVLMSPPCLLCDLLAYPDFIRQTHFTWHSKQVKSKAKNYFSGAVTQPSMSSGSPALIWWVHPTIGRLYSNSALGPSAWHLLPRTLTCSRHGRESSRRNNETRFILLLCIAGFSNNYFEQKERTSLCSKMKFRLLR